MRSTAAGGVGYRREELQEGGAAGGRDCRGGAAGKGGGYNEISHLFSLQLVFLL